MNDEQIKALRAALEVSPNNHPLRQMLAEALQDRGELTAALVEYEILVEGKDLPMEKLVAVGVTVHSPGRQVRE